MEADKSNRSASSYNILGAQNETLDKPLPPYWSTSLQASDNSGATQTPFVNSYADSYFYPYTWANQAHNLPLQCNSLHDLRGLSNRPIVAGHVPLTFHEKVPNSSTEKNMDSTKICDGNFQLGSYDTKESGENGNRSPFLKDDRDEALRSVSGSKGFSDDGYGINSDSNPTIKKQSNMMLGNGKSAEKMASVQNHNAVLANRNSTSKDLRVNSTESNLNMGTALNEFEAKPQLAKEKVETKNERKRQSNRESARRLRMRKQKECEELQRAVDMLIIENSSLKDRLMSLSEECMEINNENNSIEEELVEMYGPEALADLLAMKPTGGK